MGPGDVLALGKPGDEGVLAALHAAQTNPGQLRLLGGTHHYCRATSTTPVEVRAQRERERMIGG
eukprot:4217151-Prymnesium_polylepis.1